MYNVAALFDLVFNVSLSDFLGGGGGGGGWAGGEAGMFGREDPHWMKPGV